MQTEKSLQNRILEYLNYIPNSVAYENYNGGLVAKAFGSKIIYKKKGKFRPNGWPDVIWICEGVHIHIETKTKKGVLSKEQKAIHEKIKSCGGVVLVIKSFNEIRDYCEDSPWIRKR